MVCDRCRLVVSDVMVQLQLSPVTIELGEVDFGGRALTTAEIGAIRGAIEPLGFELIDDKKSRLIERIKKALITLVNRGEQADKIKLSEYLADALHYDYGHLSNLFSSVEGVTIEQYLIRQKIETVKELLICDELSLTEIAGRLGYSSVAHLSAQFKKVTGMPPREFKRMRDMTLRQPRDKVGQRPQRVAPVHPQHRQRPHRAHGGRQRRKGRVAQLKAPQPGTARRQRRKPALRHPVRRRRRGVEAQPHCAGEARGHRLQLHIRHRMPKIKLGAEAGRRRRHGPAPQAGGAGQAAAAGGC